MALLWFGFGVLVGLLLAFVGEWVIDLRFRRRDAGIDGEALRALQAALAQAETELSALRATLADTPDDRA